MLKHFSALFATGLLASAASAQITITAADNLPAIGDTYTYNTAAYAAPPAGGADQLFDFSTLTSTGSATFEWVDTAVYSNASQFQAQMAMIYGPDTAFYSVTGAGLERMGERNFMTILGNDIDLEIVHSNSMLELELPLTYGGAWTDQVEGTVSSDGSTGTRSGLIQGEADGWGHILLPGTVDPIPALRVYTYINEVIQIPIGGNPADVTHKRHQHDYYVPWLKMPILTSYADTMSFGLTIPERGIRYMSSAPVGMADQIAPADGFSIFPNPAQDAVTLNFPAGLGSGARVELFDATGRVLRTERVGANVEQRTLSLAGEEPGCYFLRLRNDDGVLSTQRLVKR